MAPEASVDLTHVDAHLNAARGALDEAQTRIAALTSRDGDAAAIASSIAGLGHAVAALAELGKVLTEADAL